MAALAMGRGKVTAPGVCQSESAQVAKKLDRGPLASGRWYGKRGRGLLDWTKPMSTVANFGLGLLKTERPSNMRAQTEDAIGESTRWLASGDVDPGDCLEEGCGICMLTLYGSGSPYVRKPRS